MICKQCIFLNVDENEIRDEVVISRPFHGIALYDDHCTEDFNLADLVGVICAECGAFIPADECVVIKTLDRWWSFEEAISQNFFPDDVRGFRSEDPQMKMEFVE